MSQELLLKKLRAAKEFDAKWYSEKYPDVKLSGIDPALHYLLVGGPLGRDPGPAFSLRNLRKDRKGDAENAFLSYLLEDKKPSGGVALPSDELQGKQSTGKKVEGLVGDINLAPNKLPVIRGWLALRGDAKPRLAKIVIDGQTAALVVANLFRPDLAKHNINEGYHAFEISAPASFVDGKQHEVVLVDATSEQEIKRTTAKWVHNRNYKDFSGFLANSFVNPYVSVPFREEDKRCFAAMENVAQQLVARASAIKTQPLVSVIMPAYNRMSTINEAVDSVLAQQYERVELIIIDDASTDGTLEWCRNLTDKRVRLYALQENRGASFARNEGLRHARGKYIMYLDSDNRWDARYVSAMVGAFAALPDAEAVFSGQVIYQAQNDTPSGVRFGSLNRSLLLNHNYIDMNAFCHTKAAYKKHGGFDIDLKRFIDWDLILRYSTQAKMYSVPVLLSHYFSGKASNTITGNPAFLGDFERVRRKHAVPVVTDADEASSLAIVPVLKSSGPLQRKITVVIPSYDSVDDLRSCVDSVVTLKNRKIDIVIVDNASSDETVQYLNTLVAGKIAKVIFNAKNYGFTYAVNQGIAAAAKTSDVVLLNNDAIVLRGAFEAMQNAAYDLPDCGLVVPQQLLLGGTKTLQEHVPYVDPKYACDVNLSAHHENIVNAPLFHDGAVTELSFAPFFCVYIPRHVLMATGPLDAQFGRHYRSDRIYCDVVRHTLALKIYHVADAVVVHRLQKSTDSLRNKKELTDEFSMIFKRNQWDEMTRKALGFMTAPWDI